MAKAGVLTPRSLRGGSGRRRRGWDLHAGRDRRQPLRGRQVDGVSQPGGADQCRPEGEDGTPCGRHRSEEHTSELQSRLHLVCRLLLEKKKKKKDTKSYKTKQ